MPSQKKSDHFQNGSNFDMVKPFFTFLSEKRLHSGAKIVPLFKKRYRFQPFFGKWLQCGAWSLFGKWYPFFRNMIIKEEMASL